MRTYDSIGIQVPKVLLPKQGTDLTKWAVVACDQYTSQPDYWDKVKKFVGNSSSTLKLMLPEIFLGKKEELEMMKSIVKTMKDYMDQKVLVENEGFIYVERKARGKLRKGLLVVIDLERYDYAKGSQTLVRATEGTIVERLPPRIKIREQALIELPHIMILIDDRDRAVIEPLSRQKAKLRQLYNFDLMMGSGHLEGYSLDDNKIEEGIVKALEKLSEPAAFKKKYSLKGKDGEDKKVLLFAVGDGNHSLATAKAIWENKKQAAKDKKKIMEDPARYALIELVNVHDEGLEFEPIHRVVFELKKDIFNEMKLFYGKDYEYSSCKDAKEMMSKVNAQKDSKKHFIGVVTIKGAGIIKITNPTTNLPVGTIQRFLDKFIKEMDGAKEIDYVHGKDVVCKLGSKESNIGIYLPAMDKSELFKTVIIDGALPRKTFSMGEADEKRFYMECRKIV